MKGYISTSQAAKRLHCEISTIREMCRKGELSFDLTENGGYLIEEDQPAFKRYSMEKDRTESPIISGQISSKTTKNTNPNVFYMYVKDDNHNLVLPERIITVESTLDIACADFKWFGIVRNNYYEAFTDTLAWLARNGKKIRLLISSPKGRIGSLIDSLEYEYSSFSYKICKRVHMKMMIFDQKEVYIGSANLTSAAMGDRSNSESRDNNFETGVYTNDSELVKSSIEHFKNVWLDNNCKQCKVLNCPSRE